MLYFGAQLEVDAQIKSRATFLRTGRGSNSRWYKSTEVHIYAISPPLPLESLQLLSYAWTQDCRPFTKLLRCAFADAGWTPLSAEEQFLYSGICPQPRKE